MTRTQLRFRASPGRRDELLDRLDRLEVIAAARQRPGFLAAALLVPLDDPDEVVVEGSWSSPELFQRWHDDPSREEVLGRLRDLLAEEPQTQVYRLVDSIS